MSVGKSHHYAVAEIMPRHFMQTAGDAGVANSLVQAILDDLAAHALKTIDAVIETLPVGFPGAVADSVRRGVSQRLRLLDAGTTAEDIALQ
jgi:serine/threonine-protein kinase HipA